MRWWAVLWGCAGAVPEELLAPDPGRLGEAGEDGPHGASRLALRVSARVTETVPVTLVYPSDEALQPSVSETGAVIFVHGGFVEPARYEWLAVHLASRGWAVAMPEAVLELALFEPGNVEVALAALREQSAPEGALPGLVAEDGPVVVGGHSLGGVVAAIAWQQDASIDGLLLLASYPSGSGPFSGAGPALALGGTADGLLPEAELDERLATLQEPLWFGLVEGMSHFAWTDDPSPSELRRDGEAQRPLAELRADAERPIDLFLEGTLGSGELSLLDEASPGILWR